MLPGYVVLSMNVIRTMSRSFAFDNGSMVSSPPSFTSGERSEAPSACGLGAEDTQVADEESSLRRSAQMAGQLHNKSDGQLSRNSQAQERKWLEVSPTSGLPCRNDLVDQRLLVINHLSIIFNNCAKSQRGKTEVYFPAVKW